MRKKTIVQIIFNAWAPKSLKEQGAQLTEKWIKERLAIFDHFTAQSLRVQTDPNFDVLVVYDPRSEEIVQEALKGYHFPHQFSFICKGKLDEEINKRIEGSEYFYLVRLDSDDMYHHQFMEKINRHEPDGQTEMLIAQDGYLYDAIHHRLARIHYPSPPFYTQIYKTEEYLAGKRYQLKGHQSVIHFKHQIIEGAQYVVVIHSQNTSTTFRPKRKEDIIISPLEKGEILAQFMGERGVWQDSSLLYSPSFLQMYRDLAATIGGGGRFTQLEELEELARQLELTRQELVQVKRELKVARKENERLTQKISQMNRDLSPLKYQHRQLQALLSKGPFRFLKRIVGASHPK